MGRLFSFKQYPEEVGAREPHGPTGERVDVNHVKDFCESCKREFRRLFDIDFTSLLLTTTLPEAYLGQTVNDRFMLFGSTHREERDGAVSSTT